MDFMTNPLISGFLIGLTTGPICAGTCLPLLIPFSLNYRTEHSGSRLWVFLGKFLGGRLIAYLLFGILVGFLGQRLGVFSHRLGTVAWIFLALLLLGYGLGMKLVHLSFCRVAYKFTRLPIFPFILGALTGLNLCPPFLLAITYSLEQSAVPLFAVLFFFSFFVATTLFILPVALIRYAPQTDLLVKLSRVAAVVVGTVFLTKGVMVMWLW
jgi:sulfite exporter TauE/SafE